VFRRYFAELLRLIDGSDAFEVLAHVDYPRRSWPYYSYRDFREADFEAEYREVFRALAGSGRVLEINTRSPLPSPDLLTWWREEGGGAVLVRQRRAPGVPRRRPVRAGGGDRRGGRLQAGPRPLRLLAPAERADHSVQVIESLSPTVTVPPTVTSYRYVSALPRDV
jgi:hypothetical protein